jgi:hypothetical protein
MLPDTTQSAATIDEALDGLKISHVTAPANMAAPRHKARVAIVVSPFGWNYKICLQ